MSTLGQELSREREMRGIPLLEIARQTKINIHYLTALEQDRLDLLPGEFFIKGTIRAYARCIGLHEDQALNLYLRQARHPAQTAAKAARAPSPRMSPGRGKKLAIMAAPLLALGAVLLISKPWSGGGRRASAPPRRTESAVETAAAPAAVPAAAAERPGPAAVEGLVLELSFRDEVWIRVQADQGPPEESLVRAGERKSVTASERVVLRLGRPDQVDLTINGRKAKPFPPSASAQTYEITKDNSRDYLAE
jgi:cytoskeletal protein RodZ